MKTLYWRSLGNQKKHTNTIKPIIGVCGVSHVSIIFIKYCGHSALDHFIRIACFGRGSCQVVFCFVSVFEVTLWAWLVYRSVYALAFSSSRSVFMFLKGIMCVDRASGNWGIESYGWRCGFGFALGRG